MAFIYDGTFKRDRFADWLELNNIPWPRLFSGVLALDSRNLPRHGQDLPVGGPLARVAAHAWGNAVGVAGRWRRRSQPYACCPPSEVGPAATNRATRKFIFGPSCWLRGLIKPAPGRAVAYVDWSQQEFAIAAALSGDRAMMDAYASGDPYLAFAKQAGAVPADATKQSHPARAGTVQGLQSGRPVRHGSALPGREVG